MDILWWAAPRIRIYYGNVEEFGKASVWAGREGAVRDLDLTISAMNYLGEKGYAFFRTFENNRDPDENIRHRYLFRGTPEQYVISASEAKQNGLARSCASCLLFLPPPAEPTSKNTVLNVISLADESGKRSKTAGFTITQIRMPQ